VQATDTLIEGIENAGTPDTEQGDEAANIVNRWAESTKDEFEQAQDALDDEAETISDAVDQFTAAARSIAVALTGGVQALADIVRLDPELSRALAASSTCREVREEDGS
jgi:exopolyphosphatase/pppGpp-phosphohydrolase